MIKKQLLALCLGSMATVCGSFYADAQTTVNKIQYTLNSDESAYTVTGFEDGIVDAVIEPAIDGKPVTTINQNVFKTASILKSVFIPASVTRMGNSVFQNNTSLETVTFEDGDQPLAMGGWTFNGCSSIREIVLPSRLASFGANSNFNGCSSLEKVVFRGDCPLADMKQYTFEKTSLKELDLSGLTNVTAFNANCLQNLRSEAVKVTLPREMTLLPKNFLAKCNVTEIVFPEGTTEIPQQAFDGYAVVTTVSIPSTITKIGNSAFRKCTSLASVTFAPNPGLNSSMNYCFQECTSLESIDLTPLPGVEGLVATFMKSGLKNITFSPESKMTTLNWDLFNGTPLESIDIPASVNKIGARAFYNCAGLETVSLPEGVDWVLNDAFGHADDAAGVRTVIFNQHGGKWPGNNDDKEPVSILAADTRAYCYKDVTEVPEGVVTVAPIESAGYLTYYSSTPVSLPEGVKGTAIKGVIGQDLVRDFDQFRPGTLLPAGTPVLLACENADGTLYPEIDPDAAGTFTETNFLVGTEDGTTLNISDGKVAYQFVMYTDGLYGFDRVDGASVSVDPNKACLVLPSSLAGNISRFSLSNVVTGIDEITEEGIDRNAPVYNLMGIEVDRDYLTPSIYISNGKKIVIR